MSDCCEWGINVEHNRKKDCGPNGPLALIGVNLLYYTAAEFRVLVKLVTIQVDKQAYVNK